MSRPPDDSFPAVRTHSITPRRACIPLALVQSAGHYSPTSSLSTDLIVSRIHFCILLVSRRAFVFALTQSMPPPRPLSHLACAVVDIASSHPTAIKARSIRPMPRQESR